MKKIRTRPATLLRTGLVLMATCGLWACSSGVASQNSPAPSGGAAASAVASKFGPSIQKLIQQAKQEGSLNLLWSAQFLNNGKDLPAFQDAFNSYFGLNIKFSYTPAPSMPQVASEIIEAAKAGTPAPTDVWMEDSGPISTINAAGASLSYPWASLAKALNQKGMTVPTGAIAPGQIGLAFGTNIYVIIYNTKLVPKAQVPTSYQQLLSPQWKGEVATNNYASGFYQLAAASGSWGPAKTTKFVEAFSKQIGGVVRCGDATDLLTGQYKIIAPGCSTQAITFAQREGEPLGYVVPTDGPITDLLYTGVPKTAAHPAAAALLSLFMLTPEGQQLSWQYNAYDLSLIPTSHEAQILKPLTSKGITILGPEAYDTNPKLSAYQAQYEKILDNPA